MNAKIRLDLYRVKLPTNTLMIVGVDVVNEGRNAIVSCAASYTKHAT